MKRIFFLFSLTALTIVSCKKVEDVPIEPALAAGPDQIVYAITATNDLIKFNANDPLITQSKTAITGIAAGEKLLSIDFRPATGELYGLSNASKLYIINQADGKSRVVGAAAFTPAISGTIASIDFNPTVDRIRLVTNTGQNLRLNPETGMVAATDMAINGGSSPAITGIAYTNSKAGTPMTTLYDIDQTSGKLYIQNPPNNGALVEVGSLGITFTGNAAFDIAASNNSALFSANNNFYSIDLATGKANKIGFSYESFVDIAIPTDAVAYATDINNNLLIFNPNTINSTGAILKPITGLQAGENIFGIDFRPLNGQLYALGSTSRLYSINLSNAAATQVGTGTFGTALSGTDFGFDFNPTVDRIRVVSNAGQNLRLNPIDGTVAAVDAAINPGTPMLSSAAYTNNFAGTTSTTLLVLDHNTDKLYTQIPPNNGTLIEVGNLGINIGNNNGFDISSRTNTAYLIATVGGTNNIYTVNITTGAATNPIAFPSAIKGFSIGIGF